MPIIVYDLSILHDHIHTDNEDAVYVLLPYVMQNQWKWVGGGTDLAWAGKPLQ